jgi:uncharacterized membrane protein
MGVKMIPKILTVCLGLFFIAAGINHFINPRFYYPLIPPYLLFPKTINIISGILEVVLGAGVWVPRFTKLSAVGLTLLLILFIPSHIHFIQIGSCLASSLCVPEWVAWIRLALIHPILILWTIFVSRQSNP